MKLSDIIASIGVIILLIAFLLNLYKKIPANSKPYCFMNFLGAGMCCYSSFLINFYPFVVLEAIWATFALISFIKVPRGTSN
ncbi:CBU_0592 family membrane protein [Mucilaginibacter panaciglaebae]|uniref:CBU_0592 family membrane protein n=1 Tax=Mucilaginibacter panaciglaebae TaxID=502331 RepID=UPI003CD07D19